MREGGNISDIVWGMVIGARQASMSFSETADLLEILCPTISSVYRKWSEKKKIYTQWLFSWQIALLRSEENGQTG